MDMSTTMEIEAVHMLLTLKTSQGDSTIDASGLPICSRTGCYYEETVMRYYSMLCKEVGRGRVILTCEDKVAIQLLADSSPMGCCFRLFLAGKSNHMFPLTRRVAVVKKAELNV